MDNIDSGDYIANLDQMLAFIGDVARIAHFFLTKLEAQGFTHEEAIKMVYDWNRTFWHGEHNPPSHLHRRNLPRRIPRRGRRR